MLNQSENIHCSAWITFLGAHHFQRLAFFISSFIILLCVVIAIDREEIP